MQLSRLIVRHGELSCEMGLIVHDAVGCSRGEVLGRSGQEGERKEHVQCRIQQSRHIFGRFFTGYVGDQSEG